MKKFLLQMVTQIKFFMGQVLMGHSWRNIGTYDDCLTAAFEISEVNQRLRINGRKGPEKTGGWKVKCIERCQRLKSPARFLVQDST